MLYPTLYCNRKLVNEMKLIAETEEENTMLPGIAALMTDLGIIANEYRKEEAYAVTLWSAAELSYLYADRFNLTHEEAAYLLEELEPMLRSTMAAAGVKLIERACHKNLSTIKKRSDTYIPE